jgi:hypothetical protein
MTLSKSFLPLSFSAKARTFGGILYCPEWAVSNIKAGAFWLLIWRSQGNFSGVSKGGRTYPLAHNLACKV